MRKFLSFSTAFVFLAVLVCSTAMPLVMAYGDAHAMDACPQSQAHGSDSSSACDHSAKVSLALNLKQGSTGDSDIAFKLPVLVPVFSAPEAEFLDLRLSRHPVFTTRLLSHLQPLQTIVLRF
ncbi:MAG: hypothetical protein Q8P95_01995 [bacterium]|nr:hypothetical protein [bacterium]